MRKWEKVFWTVAAGVTLATAGCGGTALYGVPDPGDADTDLEIDVADDAEDVAEEEMPAGAYGPPPDM